MLSRLRQMLSSNAPLLLDIPALISAYPNTDTPRVAHATTLKYRDAVARMSEYLHIIGKDDNPPVTWITREDYAGCHDWLNTRGTAVITTNGYRRRLRGIWHLLRKDYRLNVCDIRDITKEEPEPYQRSKAITEEHFNRVLQLSCCRDTAILLYMLDGGFRRQTIPRLAVRDTHIWQRADGQFRIASKIPPEKTSPERVIMGEHRTAVAVMNWLNIRQFPESPWLFYNMHNGEKLTATSVSEIFKDLRKRCNIPSWSNVNAHALRHKFAQNQLDKHDARTVADWMGITVETLLSVYAARDIDGLILARFGDSDYPAELSKRF